MERPPLRLKGFPRGAVAQAPFRELRREIEEFHAEYCYVLDNNEIEAWPRFFTEDALYRITARENVEAELPVGLVYCEGLAMIKDRAFAIEHTAMFAPRYLQHMVTNLRVTGLDPDGLDLAFGDATLRLPFPARVTNPGELRKTVVDLAAKARAG